MQRNPSNLQLSPQILCNFTSFDSAEIGVLKAQGAWGEIAHDLKLRQEIIRQRGRKRLGAAFSQDFLQAFVDRKRVDAKHTRRAASDLAQVVRVLAAAPTSMSAATSRSGHSDAVDSTPLPRSVEPQRLSIGTGYAGG